MTLVRSMAAAGAVLVVAWMVRPAPSRLREMATRPAAGDGQAWRPVRIGASLGEPLRRLVGRPSDIVLDARLGWSMIAGAVVALAVELPAGLGVGAAVWLTGAARAAAVCRRDDLRLTIELPDVVDLLLLGVDAGLTVRLSLAAVVDRSEGVIVGRLTDALEQVHLGARLADVLEQVQTDLGESVRPVIGVLLDAERYGTPLREPLERVGNELRTARRRQAEEAARRVPVKLLFPLVFCTLPAFALLTVVPLLAGSLPSLPD